MEALCARGTPAYRERITDVAGGAAAEHRRALNTMARRGPAASRPPQVTRPARVNQAHEQAQQRGPARAVRSDHRRGAPAAKARRRGMVTPAGGEADVLEYDRQIGNGRAHAHPANRSPARRRLQAAALTATTRAMGTRPSPMASGKSPFDVSSAIAVVMTR